MEAVPIRIAFMGSPAFALPTLSALSEAGHTIVLVVAQPDRPAGRGRRPLPPPVARVARERGLPLYQPERLRQPEDILPIAESRPDVIVVAAFGLLLPDSVLALPRHGCLNVHASLLPGWRGASPIQSAILAGDDRVGISIIQLTSRMDAGPILLRRVLEPARSNQSRPFIGVWSRAGLPAPEEDAEEMEPRLAQLGAAALTESLQPWVAGTLDVTPQDEAQATYCTRLSRSDAALDWSRPAQELARQVRAFRGRGDAFTTWNGAVLKVLSAAADGESPPFALPGEVVQVHESRLRSVPFVATGRGLLALYGLALAGRAPVAAPDFLNGHPTFVNTVLGDHR